MKAQKEIPKLKALGLYPAKTIGDGMELPFLDSVTSTLSKE